MKPAQELIHISDDTCPVRKSLELLGGKWVLLILYQINTREIRYGELKRAIPGISEKMLIQELNRLVRNKLVTKHSFAEMPPRVVYSLTSKGLKALPIAETLACFGLENLP